MSAPLIRRASVAAILGAWWIVGPGANGADIDFYRDVSPILKSNCIACHNKTTTKAALNMETPEAMRKGGDSGEGVAPGSGAESLIYQAAAHLGNVEMPPRGNKSGARRLNPDELALLKAWIDQGAKDSIKQARQVVWHPLPPGVHPIYSVAMTRDGRFAACGRANRVFVYDLATRQLVTGLTDASEAAHRAIVQSLAFSPDGVRLASGSFREVKIWRRQDDLSTTRKGDPAFVSIASALSGDGKLAVCTDKHGTMSVLDTAGGKRLKTFSVGDQGGAPLLSVSPDASKVALYGPNGTLSLWKLADGQRIASKRGLVGVRALTWTRDGKAIATGGDDKIVRLWSLPAGEKPEFAAPKELKGATGPLAIVEAGADVVIAASADGKVRLWNVPETKLIRELTIAGVVSLGLSGDGKRLAAGRADGVVQVWDLVAGTPIIELSGDPGTATQLAALEWTVAAEGLEIAFQKQEAARIEAHSRGLDDLIKKANESIVAVKKELVERQGELKAATDARDAAQKVATASAERVAKAPEGKPDVAPLKSQKDADEKLSAVTKAESTALAAFKASEIHLKDAEAEAQSYAAAKTRNRSAFTTAAVAGARAKAAQDRAAADAAATRKAVADRKWQPLAVRFSSNQRTVAAAWNDGSLRAWAIASGRPIRHVPGGGAATTASLVTGGDNAFVASSPDGTTTSMSTASRWVLERTIGEESASSPFVDRVNSLRFSPDGKTLAAAGGEPTRSGDISLWDVASGKLVIEWKERHSDAVLSLDFSPDGQRLASGGADKIARVTDLASGKILNVFEGHTHHVLGVSFRADGRVLATAGADNVVVVWDMISGERTRKIEGWSKEVTSLQFIGATNQILTSAGDNLVRIVDDNGGVVRTMPKLPDFMQSAASGANAGVLIGGGEDSVLRVWNGTTGQELATFGADATAKKP